jgi:HD-like signal output (HDOD) protein
MPRVVVRFLELTKEPSFSYDRVVQLLSSDAGMVSEILRMANSSLFGLAGRVTSLRTALTLLGPRRVGSLVLVRSLVGQMSACSTGGIDSTYFWRRSLTTGGLSARLAAAVEPAVREEAFLSGLLADIGIVILARAFGDQYEPIAERYRPGGRPFQDEEERALVEVTHADVSAMVLGYWKMPETICKAVNLQHTGAITATDEATVIARIINAADRVARLLCDERDPCEATSDCIATMQFLGLDAMVLVDVLGEMEQDIEDLSVMLRTSVISRGVYGRTALALREHLSAASC